VWVRMHLQGRRGRDRGRGRGLETLEISETTTEEDEEEEEGGRGGNARVTPQAEVRSHSSQTLMKTALNRYRDESTRNPQIRKVRFLSFQGPRKSLMLAN